MLQGQLGQTVRLREGQCEKGEWSKVPGPGVSVLYPS